MNDESHRGASNSCAMVVVVSFSADALMSCFPMVFPLLSADDDDRKYDADNNNDDGGISKPFVI